MKTALLTGVLVSLTSILTLVVIASVVMLSPNTGGAKDYPARIINNVNRDRIRDYLRNLTTYPHPAGSDRNHDIAKFIASEWRNHGLQDVKIIPYNVFLSKADQNRTNYFQVIDSSGGALHRSSAHQPSVDEFPQEDQDQILSFNAFSGNGVVNTSKVVYANYGTTMDFLKLNTLLNISVDQAIVLIRYGQIFRGDKVRNAAKNGALGVILYTDPDDSAPLKGPKGTYPDTIYAPAGGVQLGSLVLQGDLLTPGYPASDYAFRIPQVEADMPRIPVLPVGYADAYQILSRLEGDPVTTIPGWQGGLNITYKFGGSLVKEATIKLSVSNINSLQNIYNVIGAIPGEEEPDRFVLLGNHHDAWGYGGTDPSSGTANMLELSRVLGEMYQDGWRPRRTMVFCSWDAEEPGLIGSTEYAEQFTAALKAQAVVYINVDTVLGGNFSFAASGLPHLADVTYELAKMVPNPDQKEYDEGRTSMYDTWVARFPNGASPAEPAFGSLGSGSDYKAYQFNLGIPCLDTSFTEGPDEKPLPLYHMAYETFEMSTELMDIDLHFHEASTRMWGLLGYKFASTFVLPLNVVKLSAFVQSSLQEFKDMYKEKLVHLNVTMTSVESAASRFNSATQQFLDNIGQADLENELILRRYNDAMMLMDKAFLAPRGLPRRPILNHVLVAPNATNAYNWETFPGLQDYLRDESILGTKNTRRGFLEHTAVIAYHLDMAANVLKFTLW